MCKYLPRKKIQGVKGSSITWGKEQKSQQLEIKVRQIPVRRKAQICGRKCDQTFSQNPRDVVTSGTW